MPEYVVGLDNCICKNPNVRSRFGELSRSSKAIGFITYSPEFGMFSCIEYYINASLYFYLIFFSDGNDFDGKCLCAPHTYCYDVDVHQLRRYCHFPVTVERYFDLRVEVRCEIMLFPRDLYLLRFFLAHRSVVEAYALGGCGRSLWKKHIIKR